LTKRQDVDVRITKYTVSIGAQTYQLRHIARVQRWELRPAYGMLASRYLRRGVGMLVALVIANAFLVAAHTPVPLLQVVDVLAACAILAVTGVGFARAVTVRRRHVLLVETTGRPIGALSSDKRETIDNLVAEITDAMENPPDSPRVIHVGNVILGDQINQTGDNNTGKREVNFGG
jgi:hypothetical protein